MSLTCSYGPRRPFVVLLDGLHEIVGYTHAVIGVLVEDRRVGFTVEGTVITGIDQSPGFALFTELALDELHDVWMVDVQDHHLCRAPRLAAAPDDAGESVIAFHEGDRAASDAAAGEAFFGASNGREVRARSRAPFEQHALCFREVQDGVHRVVDGVDEARGALGFRLDAAVEPHGGVERGVLVQEQECELVPERFRIVLAGEIAAFSSPTRHRVDDASDELTRAVLALVRVEPAMKIFRRDDVGRHLRPALRDFDVVLLEDDAAFFVSDDSVSDVPFDGVVGRDAFLGEDPLESKRFRSLLDGVLTVRARGHIVMSGFSGRGTVLRRF